MKIATLLGSVLFVFSGLSACAQPNKSNPAFQHGLWSCSMPASASYLDQHFTDARGLIEFPYSVLDGLAHTNDTQGMCKRVNADNLKVVGFDSFWRAAIVSDGKKESYVGMLSYQYYMTYHVVRSN